MKFGDYRIEIIPDTEFWLDGGAMFGVVPRNLWSRVCPPDDQNRIRLNMNCLYVEAGTERILIDTGIGEKWTTRQLEIYGITRQRPFTESLRAIAGVKPEEISIVVNTHLHFDHAGGNTRLSEQGVTVPAFRNARYLVARDEWEHAKSPTERDRASYLPANWQPLEESGQLEVKDGDFEIVPGVLMETHTGHNRSLRCPRLNSGKQTLFGFSDIVPTRAHLAPAWIMGYDLYPVETLETKKRLLPQAIQEDWTCLFYHDPDVPLGRIIDNNGKFEAVPAV
ncbi:MAG TPA: MBL fold metallo-hydrolase [Pyrinomonadaceae bacterium]|jgi:glyoxylase-like metal-dependent hydrolase (beta-lactamase superfamily II)|nr:MBL fold metallo-hydrolase [Pyrinomonadaceae bacterium]